jgi:hypothetical protein
MWQFGLLDVVAVGGLALACAGVIWMTTPAPDVDTSFAPVVSSTASGWRPQRILIDEGHWNSDVAMGRYKPLQEVIGADLFPTETNRESFHPDFLRGVSALVIVNPLPLRPAVEYRLQSVGLLHTAGSNGEPAMTALEARDVTNWIRAGGGLLLVLSKEMSARAAEPLLRELNLGFSRGQEGLHEYSVAPSPLTPADPKRENHVLRLTGYGGLALDPPPGSLVLARDQGSGTAACAAFELGKGRVVVVSDDGLMTALRIRSGGQTILAGMSDPGADAQQFALNVVRWLAGAQ